jgi:hypothetical protein
LASTATDFNRARAAANLRRHYLDPGKMGLGQADHNPAVAPVFDEQIGPTPEDEHRQPTGPAKTQDGGQIVFRGRLDVEVNRSANPQRGAARQRFVTSNHGPSRKL